MIDDVTDEVIVFKPGQRLQKLMTLTVLDFDDELLMYTLRDEDTQDTLRASFDQIHFGGWTWETDA